MDDAIKVRENRLRRVAERQGYRLTRSRRRDPLALGYGRYMITTPAGKPVAGTDSGQPAFTLAEAETWLTDPGSRP